MDWTDDAGATFACVPSRPSTSDLISGRLSYAAGSPFPELRKNVASEFCQAHCLRRMDMDNSTTQFRVGQLDVDRPPS